MKILTWTEQWSQGMCSWPQIICQCGALMVGGAFCLWSNLHHLGAWQPRVYSSVWQQLTPSTTLWIQPLMCFSETNTFIDFPCLSFCTSHSPSIWSLFPLCPPWRWAATRSLRLSPWASSSPPSSRHRLPPLPRSPSTVYLSQSRGTSSCVSQTSRTSAPLSAVFTSASLSSPSHSKVGVESPVALYAD